MPNLFLPWSRGFLCLHLLLFLLGASSARAATPGELAKQELVGPVKSVVTKHPQLRTTHQFDRNGRLVELHLTSSNEANSSDYVFHYDTTGRLIEEDVVEADGHVRYKKLYRYGSDVNGRESAIVATTGDGALAHAAFSFYDERGLLAEEIEISGSGTAEKSLYDVRGDLVYTARYFHGKLVLEATHHHGPLGRLRESRFYSGDGSLMRRDLFRYDEAGHRIEQQSEMMRSAHLRRSVVTYEIDGVGNWTKETVRRWTEKNGIVSLSETTVSRERQITYYD